MWDHACRFLQQYSRRDNGKDGSNHGPVTVVRVDDAGAPHPEVKLLAVSVCSEFDRWMACQTALQYARGNLFLMPVQQFSC